MVSAKRIVRILLEGIGEFMIILSAIIYGAGYSDSITPSRMVIILILIGIGLRIYADEIYTTIRDGNLKGRIWHFEK